MSHDARDADWVATSGADVIHVECQGYRDPGFLERLFWYHLGFTLCHCTRHVRSVALWLTRPSADQRVGRIVHGDVTLHTTTVVLAEEPAAAMLQGDGTACFAPGADPGPWSVSELCQRTAARMVERNAGYYERHMAVVAAMMRGRYDEMVKAMSDHNMEPVIIEDLVKFGEDRGREEGLAEGLLSLVRVIERKMGRACTGEERAKLRMLLVEVGPERVADVAMDSDGAQLAAWLSAPVAK